MNVQLQRMLTVTVGLALATLLYPHAVAQDVSLHGRVLEQNSQGVIVGTVADAQIELLDARGQPSHEAVSDDTGYYALRKVKAGKYHYRVTRGGNQRASTGDQGELSIEVTSGELVRDFVLSRFTPAVSTSDNLAKLEVTVVKQTENGFEPIPYAAVGLTGTGGSQPILRRTDPAGVFAMELTTGDWTARVTANGFQPVPEQTVTLQEGVPEQIQFVLLPVEAADSQAPTTQPPSTVDNGIHGFVFGKDVSTDAAGEVQITDLGAIPNARIVLQQSNGLRLGSTSTNAQGFYAFPSVPIGRIEYKIFAENFRTEENGRSFELPPGNQSRVVNFSLVRGTSESSDTSDAEPVLNVAVLADRDGSPRAVEQATIMVWRTGHEDQKIIVDAPGGKNQQPIPLTPGNWTVAANSPEFGMSLQTTLTLGTAQTAEHEIYYPQSVRDVRALVKISGPGSVEAQTPNVRFMRPGSSADSLAIPTLVNPITAEELASISGESSTDRWYWATPAQPLSANEEYLARAELSGFESADSAPHTVEETGVKVFRVTLLGEEQLSSISGLAELEQDGSRQPLPNANVRFEHEALGLVKDFVSDASGNYQGKLSEGDWWGKVVSVADEPELGPSEQVRVSVPEGGSATMNFLLSRTSAIDTNRLVRALVKVLPSQGRPAGMPSVSFVRSSGETFATKVAAPSSEELSQLGLDSSGTDNGWYWAAPVEQLAAGTYRAESNLEGYFPDATSDQAVGKEEVKVFHLKMRPKIELGSLAGYVRDQESGEIIEGATVDISLDESPRGRLPTSSNGSYGPVELTQGKYLLVASAKGYFNNTVSGNVAPGKNTDLNIELRREPPPPPPSEAYAIVTVNKNPGCAPQQPPEVVFAGASTSVQAWDVTFQFEAGSVDRLKSVALLGTNEQPRWVELAKILMPQDTPQLTLEDPQHEWSRLRAVEVVRLLEKKQELPEGSLELVDIPWIASQFYPYEAPAEGKLVVRLVDKSTGTLPAIVTPLTSSAVVDVYKAQPAQPLAPGSYSAIASLPHYGTQFTEELSVGGQTVVFNLVLNHEPMAVEFTPYAWRDTPEDQQKLSSVRTLSRQIFENRVSTEVKDPQAIVKDMRLEGSLSGVEILLWPDGFPRQSERLAVQQTIKLQPGYWWTLPLTSGVRGQAVQPQRILIPCAGLEYDFTVPESDSETGSAVVRVRTTGSLDSDQADPAPTSFWLAPVDASGNPDMENRLRLTKTAFIPSPDGSEAWHWLDVAKKRLEPGNYMAFARRETDAASDSTIGYVAAGVTTVFELSLASQNLPPEPNELLVEVRLSPPADSPVAVNVTAQHVATKLTRPILPHTSIGFGWPKAGIDAGLFRAELPAGAWKVDAFAEGYEAVQESWPVLLTSGDRERVVIELQKIASEPPLAMLEALVRVERIRGAPAASQPEISFTIESPATVVSDSSQSPKLVGRVMPAPDEMLKLRGIRLEAFPESDWYIAAPTVPISPGIVSASASLAGYRGEVERKSVMPDVPNYFFLEVVPDRNETGELVATIYGTVSITQRETKTRTETYSVDVDGRQEERTREAAYTVDVPKQVPGVLVSLEPLNGVTLLPSVATTKTTEVEGSFEFTDLPAGEYRLSAAHPGWKTETQTIAVSMDGGTKRIGPIELQLEPCDAEYEGFLREIVTAGWNSINSAQQNHKLAKQRNPEDVRADFALALAAIKHENLELAFSSLASVLRTRSPDPLWDRALEAYLWIDLEHGNAKTLKNLFAGNRQIYGQDRNYASLDTARLMGTVTGMLLGPWNEKPVGNDGEPLAKQLESKLSPAHAVEMKAGQEAVLQKFRPMFDKLVGDSRAANRQQQQMDAQRARLNRELEQAKAALANKQAEVDQVCRLAEQKSAPWKESRQINEKELAQKQMQQKTKQQQLRSLPAASPNRSDLEAAILALGLEIAELKKATAQLTTRIDTESTSCAKAQQAFTAFSNQQNAIVSQITDQINELGKGTNAPDPEIPAELEKLDTYYTYPLEPRRAEFLQGLGCGEEVPNAPRGAANPQPTTLRVTLKDVSTGKPAPGVNVALFRPRSLKSDFDGISDGNGTVELTLDRT
ncbi:MAG: carboxypeptidase regulatory-like domain-containing protein [Pirellulaceae bacterium]|nr:carboxypeptidase regulatory-like domain-containing protein [Pirellulaceae bacterium]